MRVFQKYVCEKIKLVKTKKHVHSYFEKFLKKDKDVQNK